MSGLQRGFAFLTFIWIVCSASFYFGYTAGVAVKGSLYDGTFAGLVAVSLASVAMYRWRKMLFENGEPIQFPQT